MGSAVFWLVMMTGLACWAVIARHRSVERDRQCRRFDADLRNAARPSSSNVRVVGPTRPLAYDWDKDAPECGPLAEYRQTG